MIEQFNYMAYTPQPLGAIVAASDSRGDDRQFKDSLASWLLD